MNTSYSVLSSVLLVFSGCVTNAPVPPPDPTHSASLRATWRGHDAYYVARVDDIAQRRPMLARDWQRMQPIAPGARSLTVNYEGLEGAANTPRSARVSVKAVLEPGVAYAPDGRADGRTVVIWIKRLDSGSRVSDEVSAPKTEREPLRPPELPIVAPEMAPPVNDLLITVNIPPAI